MTTEEKLIKSAEEYHDQLLKKSKEWHTGQRVGMPQTVKEINAQVQGFEDGYNHAMSLIVCPFCKECDFDEIGLRHHLQNHCEKLK